MSKIRIDLRDYNVEVVVTTYKEVVLKTSRGISKLGSRSVIGVVNRIRVGRKNSTVIRTLTTAIEQSILDVMWNKNMRSYVTSSIPNVGSDIPIVHTHVEDNYFMIQTNGGKLLYKCVHGDFKNPIVHDKEKLTQGFFDSIYKVYKKYTKTGESDKIKETNDLYKMKALEDETIYIAYEYLKKDYTEVTALINDVTKVKYLIQETANAHRMLTSKLNIKHYPKLKNLIFKNESKTRLGTYSHEQAITINYSKDVQNVHTTYFHEYGHYIHHYYTTESKNWEHNKFIFESMTKQLKQMKTMQDIKNKYIVSRERTRTGRHRDILSSFGNYIYSDSEVIARMFECYLHHANGLGLLMTTNRGFTLEEIDIFKKHMMQLKL